jgi:outer membrane protease
MAKFRKKPVVIEATQWFKDGDHPAVYESGLSGCYHIETLEGEVRVRPGDWIITGVKDEHYPCKPDIFEMTYAPAGESNG